MKYVKSDIFFSFNFNEKKKVPLKIWFEEGSCKNIFAGGVRIFNRGRLKIFQKRGLGKKEVEKKVEGELSPSKNYE